MALKNELRLNNLINCIYHDDDDNKTSCIGRVMCIDDTGLGEWVIWVDSEAKAEEYDSFEPISLTEEWLLKFGIQGWFGNNRFQIQRTTDKLFEVIAWKNGISFWLCHLEYVHQLQNLYFALTGEELNVINNG